ncbi:carboxymuconolactone decarboxylase family protein [Chromobacterium sp. IIBBL 290-4]|uniref:carboxymuconolactone decarboxylase family protein n=1 Tax=Chromobacterium sp. IIBBL 290-4 TaxID=2953890 RepID=UPI0020B85485|nr:carboxymuconolactone decarboxylase family protein [Chromobacterium sp. IIBBL 290-4]UTH72783.1 carboxymuconolactone decarboxylase family protein [Chromobacterium sp. IIBBL 290-4]
MFSPQEALPRLAPKLDQLTREVLFADVWRRDALSPRERSLITIAALIGQARPQALAFHLRRGLENGLSAEELSELLTHLAFYVGWPSATAALEQLDAVLANPAR